MTWPLSQDFNEAVQNPATAFADPDLKSGTPATGPHGVPLPRSGNFADVYQITGPDSRRWAVKCFTRPVAPDLGQRYQLLADHLDQASLPFTVGFDYLAQGIVVRGKRYPVVKMPWVDGFPINQFVRDHLNRATLLEAMLSLWVRLCRRLRETGMAHCDLQHGNVLLVPAGGKANALELKLVDYDGMFVPALAGRPTGEAGHAAFQHPERAMSGIYSADLDRFPHLVVATALRGLLVGGLPLWQAYDTGDNLLFTEKDFAAPNRSRLMRALWDTGDPFTVGLLAHLVLSSQKPLVQTPWLDQLMPEGRPPVLMPSQERQAADLLGVPVAVAVPHALPVASAAPATLDFAANDPPRARQRKTQTASGVIAAFVLGGLLLIGVLVGVGIVLLGGQSKPADVARGESQPAARDPAPETHSTTPPHSTNPSPAPSPINPPGVGVETPTIAPPPRPVLDSPQPIVRASGPREIWSVPADVDSARDPTAIAFSADGRWLIANEQDSSRINTLDAATGRRIAAFRDFPTGRAIAFHPLPDGKVLAAGPDPFLLVFDPATGRASGKVPVPVGLPGVSQLTTSRDGKYVLLVGGGRAIVLDIDTGRAVVNKETADPPSALLASDGSKVAIVESGGTVQFYGLPTGRPTLNVSVPLPGVLIQALAPTRNLLTVRDVRNRKILADIHIIDLTTLKRVRTLTGNYELAAPLFTPDERFLVVAMGTVIEVWDTATWEKTATLTIPRGPVVDFTVVADGRRIAVATARTLHLFDLGGDRMPSVAAVGNPAMPARPEMMRPVRKPAPDAAAIAKADAAVRETYKADFARKAPAERRKLLEKLSADAEQTLDPAGRYALFRAAIALAVELADVPQAVRAIESIGQEFAIDPDGEKVIVVEKAAGAASSIAQHRAIAEAATELLDDYLARDEYDHALKLAALTATAWNKTNQPTLARDIEARQQHIRKLKEAFEPVQKAAMTLKANPTDAAAAVVVGQYRCFVQGRWEDGLPLLATGVDPGLRKLAELDLKAGTDAATTDMQRGSAWADYALTRPEGDRPPYLGRARYWFARALVGQRGGLERAMAENKLAFTAAGIEYRPGLIAELFTGPLLKTKRKGQIELDVDLATRDLHALHGPALRMVWTGVLVAPVAGRYRIVADTNDSVRIRLFAKPDEKTLIDSRGGSKPSEAIIVLPEKPVPVVIEFAVAASPTARMPNHTFALKWIKPGGKTAELIPPEALYHAKKAEELVTDK